MSGVAMAGIALGLALLVGVMIWAFTGDRQTASTTTPVPSITTGQGRTNVTPGAGQNVPNPTPPVPRSPSQVSLFLSLGLERTPLHLGFFY